MTIVEKPLQNPGFCFICKHSNDIEYWDSHRYFDSPYPLPEEGRKYVCRNCVFAAAREFGFLPPEEAQVLKDRTEYLEQENVEVRMQSNLADTIREAAKTLAAGHAGVAASLAPPEQQSVADVAKVEDAEIIDTVTPEAEVTEKGRAKPNKK